MQKTNAPKKRQLPENDVIFHMINRESVSKSIAILQTPNKKKDVLSCNKKKE